MEYPKGEKWEKCHEISVFDNHIVSSDIVILKLSV